MFHAVPVPGIDGNCAMHSVRSYRSSMADASPCVMLKYETERFVVATIPTDSWRKFEGVKGGKWKRTVNKFGSLLSSVFSWEGSFRSNLSSSHWFAQFFGIVAIEWTEFSIKINIRFQKSLTVQPLKRCLLLKFTRLVLILFTEFWDFILHHFKCTHLKGWTLAPISILNIHKLTQII